MVTYEGVLNGVGLRKVGYLIPPVVSQILELGSNFDGACASASTIDGTEWLIS